MTKKYKDEDDTKKFYMTTTSRLNMRAGTSKEDDILLIIPKGQKVLVLCNQCYHEDWYYIKYKDVTGFCMKEFLK